MATPAYAAMVSPTIVINSSTKLATDIGDFGAIGSGVKAGKPTVAAEATGIGLRVPLSELRSSSRHRAKPARPTNQRTVALSPFYIPE